MPRSTCHEWHGTLHIYITIMMNRDMSNVYPHYSIHFLHTQRSGCWSRDFWRLAPLHLDQISAKRTLFIAKINHNIHPSVSSINLQYFQKLQARIRDSGPETRDHPTTGRVRRGARQQTKRACAVRPWPPVHPDLRVPVPPQVHTRRQGLHWLRDILSDPRDWRQFQVMTLHIS